MRRTAAWICATLLLGLAASPPARAATVTVAPPTAALAPLGTQQFTATVNGTASTAVTWMVNGIPGGAPLLGTISTTGLYTAPADVPAALQVAIEAEDQAAPLANGSASAGVSASPATGSTFFVATTGNDTGPGSEAAPWLTIQHAVEKVPAGSTVLVQSGTYNELVTITRSGSATAGFITIAAAPGATPIVDGTGLKIPNGENGLFTLENVSFVRVIGFEVQNYTSSSAALDPVGIYVIGAGSNIEIRNNHIHDIVTTVPNSNGDALGIAIYGTSAKQSLSGIVIDGNQLDDLTLGFSELMALSGNVDGFQVTNNLIHDNNNIGIDIAGYEPVETKNLALDRARNGYVAGNTVFNISSATNPAYQGQLSSDGIYVDGGENIVIERNLVHDTDLGIEVASEHQVDHKPVFAQKVIVRDNVVYSSNIVGISIGGFGPGVGGTESTVIANNTMVGDGSYTGKGANQYDLGEFQIQFHASGNALVNNIVSALPKKLLAFSIATTPTDPVKLDHNLYDSSQAATATLWIWLAKNITGFSNWIAKSGNDAHSLFADPDFTDAATNDYSLAAGSPAIGAGEKLPLSQTGLLDFAGNPRTTSGKIDLGAFQN